MDDPTITSITSTVTFANDATSTTLFTSSSIPNIISSNPSIIPQDNSRIPGSEIVITLGMSLVIASGICTIYVIIRILTRWWISRRSLSMALRVPFYIAISGYPWPENKCRIIGAITFFFIGCNMILVGTLAVLTYLRICRKWYIDLGASKYWLLAITLFSYTMTLKRINSINFNQEPLRKIIGYVLIFILQWTPPMVYVMDATINLGGVGNMIQYIINEGLWDNYESPPTSTDSTYLSTINLGAGASNFGTSTIGTGGIGFSTVGSSGIIGTSNAGATTLHYQPSQYYKNYWKNNNVNDNERENDIEKKGNLIRKTHKNDNIEEVVTVKIEEFPPSTFTSLTNDFNNELKNYDRSNTFGYNNPSYISPSTPPHINNSSNNKYNILDNNLFHSSPIHSPVRIPSPASSSDDKKGSIYKIVLTPDSPRMCI
ncbi:2961_t:CDS:2 [Diversispora eburnea]|uniref:2961_t:CDS:1 n=1 Tax=Diversispora eburnea TaxID=1213867 RepID=A0A9N9G718_9GLOM|nr:2961_t:CDS:2 [Diversispora eburnea]